jgi:hypothetical protein
MKCYKSKNKKIKINEKCLKSIRIYNNAMKIKIFWFLTRPFRIVIKSQFQKLGSLKKKFVMKKLDHV